MPTRMNTQPTKRRRAGPSARRRARIVNVTGVATAINSRAARHDVGGVYFQRDPHGRHAAVEARVLDLVTRCEQFALAAWGRTFDVHVRLDDRNSRSRSRGGLYHSRWKTERVDPRAEYVRRGGISIAVAARVPLAADDPFRTGRFREYTHLRPWGDIGETDAFTPLDVCVAHEVAHAFQREAGPFLCERLGLHPRAHVDPHGRLFAEVYARLRRHLGLIDSRRPAWLELPSEARGRALTFTRQAIPPESAVLAATDPAAYRRQRRAAQQRARRQAKRNQQASGTVPLAVNAGMEVTHG
jgi:hypothetical protein